MHELISTKTKISIVVFLTIALFIIFLLVQQLGKEPGSFTVKAALSAAGWVVSALTFASLLLANEKVWKFLARPGLLKFLGVPPMIGKWEGEVNSNYSRLDSLRRAAQSNEANVNVDSPEFRDSTPLLNRPAILEIRASLWNVRVILETNAAADNHPGIRSTSIVSKAIRGADDSVLLWYLYDSDVRGEPSGNDEKSHRGAALLTFDSAGTAQGEYWTDRNWRKGMNTAGSLKFKQVEE